MDDGGPTASIILFVMLILTDMFFYGFGSAINNLNIKDIEKKAEEEKDTKSGRLAAIIENPAKYVNMVQLIVTLINIVMGSFYLGIWLRGMRRFVAAYIEPQLPPAAAIGAGVTGMVTLILAVAVLTYILLTFGVLLPKKLAAQYPEKWAYMCINPVYYVMKILSPFTWLVTVSVNGVLRLFGMKADDALTDVTEEEIISMVNEGHEQGVLLATEAEMITNIFEFGDKEAHDIMTHRKNIVAVEGSMPLKEAVAFMLDANNSRFPVYEENMDHIIGILHLRDAMRIHASKEDINLPVKEVEGLLREAVFIPETKNIDALFQMMQSTKTQMVIVVDEYGQTSGLLAMEDILEEIVGNILDEYDEDEEHIEATDNADEYIIEGKTPLEELEERFGISFDEEEFETLNGFLISKMDKIPEEDETFEIEVDGYNFKILSVENKMIQSVLVTKVKEPETEEKTAEENDEKKEN
ncbi:MAG TPA: HlyC/CorC family transporter [Lachnospiraceae bacterium]|nr:HlyC/CorC family transporter [Lachnospiraceae bacterium]